MKNNIELWKYIMTFETKQENDLPKNKFTHLLSIKDIVEVPPAICVNADYFNDMLSLLYPDIQKKLILIFNELKSTSGCYFSKNVKEIEELLDVVKIHKDNYKKIKKIVLNELSGVVTFAVRSCAEHEDSRKCSYAGIYDSVLNIMNTELIWDSMITIWKSYYNCSALAARIRDNNYNYKTEMNIIIQEMIEAEYSGVAFSVNPNTNEKKVCMEWVRGRGEQLVSGVRKAEYCTEDNINILELGVQEVVLAVKSSVEKLRVKLGYEIDMEWVWNGKLYVVQVRPITTSRQIKIMDNAYMEYRYLYLDDKVSDISKDFKSEKVVQEYITKRAPLYRLAHKEKIDTGASFFIVGNLSGFQKYIEEIISMFDNRNEEVIIDIDNSIRQNIIRKDFLRDYLDGIFGGQAKVVNAMILRDYIKGDTGIISTMIDGITAIVEFTHEGLLKLNRGLAKAIRIEIVKKGEDFEYLDYENHIFKTFTHKDLETIYYFTLAAQTEVGESQIEWAMREGKLYLIDYTQRSIGEIEQMAEDNIVICSGYARGRTFIVDNDNDLEKLSISPGVSVNKIDKNIESSRILTLLLEKIKQLDEKPVIVCKKPYAILSFVADYVKGFIFEEGSILCHLAIILREQHKPSIVIGEKINLLIEKKNIIATIDNEIVTIQEMDI